MKLWLIYDRYEAKRNSCAIQMYLDGCRKRNIDIELKIIEDGIEFDTLPDNAIVRTMAPELSEKLEQCGVRVRNNAFLSKTANDKAETYRYLKERGIRMPETYEVTKDFVPPFYPIVLKPAGGKGGRDVCMIHSFEEYTSYRTRVREKCIAQRPVSDLGKDLRVYIIGGKIVAAMLRSSDKDFRSNFCLGGQAKRRFLSKEEEAEVMKVASLFDIDYAGIDFMFDNGRIIFNEIEDVVGARMIYAYTDINIIEKYLDYIVESSHKLDKYSVT